MYFDAVVIRCKEVKHALKKVNHSIKATDAFSPM